MTFAAQAIFANLAEKERILGHHSTEGQAIRTLSRALQGWMSGSLGRLDVVNLCDQAMEDWLKARLQVSAWSATDVRQMLTQAVAAKLLTPAESVQLQKLHDLRARSHADVVAVSDVEAALASTIGIIERHWL